MKNNYHEIIHLLMDWLYEDDSHIRQYQQDINGFKNEIFECAEIRGLTNDKLELLKDVVKDWGNDNNL